MVLGVFRVVLEFLWWFWRFLGWFWGFKSGFENFCVCSERFFCGLNGGSGSFVVVLVSLLL